MKRRSHSPPFLYDRALPADLIPQHAARDDDADDDQDDDEVADPADSAEGSPDRGDDDTDTDDADSDDSDDLDDDGEEVRDQRNRKASREAAKYRHKFKAERDRADELQAKLDAASNAPGSALMQEALRERDFYKMAATQFNDIGAAWKLVDHSTLDDTAESMEKAVARVKREYPFLSDDPSADDNPKKRTTQPPTEKVGGSPSNRRRDSGPPKTDLKTLRAKYPAFGRRR